MISYKKNRARKDIIGEDGDSEQTQEEKRKEALERAYELRNFEITNFLTRSNYMYLIIGALFIGFYRTDDKELRYIYLL